MPAQASADDLAPSITDFTWTNPWADYYFFTGTVEDEIPEGCIVVFGGILEGAAAEVDEYGNFYLFTVLPEGLCGDAYAIAVDVNGRLSDVAYAFVN